MDSNASEVEVIVGQTMTGMSGKHALRQCKHWISDDMMVDATRCRYHHLTTASAVRHNTHLLVSTAQSGHTEGPSMFP